MPAALKYQDFNLSLTPILNTILQFCFHLLLLKVCNGLFFYCLWMLCLVLLQVSLLWLNSADLELEFSVWIARQLIDKQLIVVSCFCWFVLWLLRMTSLVCCAGVSPLIESDDCWLGWFLLMWLLAGSVCCYDVLWSDCACWLLIVLCCDCCSMSSVLALRCCYRIKWNRLFILNFNTKKRLAWNAEAGMTPADAGWHRWCSFQVQMINTAYIDNWVVDEHDDCVDLVSKPPEQAGHAWRRHTCEGGGWIALFSPCFAIGTSNYQNSCI